MRTLCAVVICTLLALPALAAGKGEPGRVFPARVELSDEEAQLRRLGEIGIDVDGVFDGWARLYLLEEELRKLRHLGFDVVEIPNEAALAAARPPEGLPHAVEGIPPAYHTYDTLKAEMAALASQFPSLARLESIGQSVEKRELWMMKITANPDEEEFEPEVAYIAAMHGDEVVGKELTLYLIRYVLENYGSDARISELIDGTELWILPSMNPDGTELAQRYNAEGINLNRDFPDQFVDPVNTPDGRAPETAAVMSWGATHSTNLSANLHGGALVINYPFDNNTQNSSTYSPSPDDAMFVSISRTYADANPAMVASNGHPSYDNGICNGADWYAIHGGMQDWNYVWRGNAEVTAELGDVKWPPASELPSYWDDNLESMLAYFERVHDGVRGIVTAADSGAPLAATVRVAGNDFPSHTDPDVGDYHRILLPGHYTLEFDAVGYSTAALDVTVEPGPAARYDVVLEPLDVALHPVDSMVRDGIAGDGRLDPGESTNLEVFLRNLGVSATSVSAELLPVGWYAGIERAGALYPDLDPGATTSSLAPHHRISLSPAVPGGHKVGFALRWTTDQGSGESEPFFVPVGDAACTTYDSTDVPLAILDHETTESGLVVVDEAEIYDLFVAVDVDHPYIGDLWLTLLSPSGTPLTLHNRSGGSTDGIVGTFGLDLSTSEPLARLHGETADGSWKLRARDGASGDSGTLNGWGLEICGRPLETATPEMRFRSLAKSPEGTLLTWWRYPGMESYRVYRSADPSSAGAFLDVTAEDDLAEDTRFLDTSNEPLVFYLVTAVGPHGEGPAGHHGE